MTARRKPSLRHQFVPINLVMLSGHLTHDPELKISKDGMPCMDFQIGVHGSGPKHRSHFITVCAFGDLAIAVAKLRKGLPVVIEGEIRDSVFKKGNYVTRRAKVWAKHVWRMTEDESVIVARAKVDEDAHNDGAPTKRVRKSRAELDPG